MSCFNHTHSHHYPLLLPPSLSLSIIVLLLSITLFKILASTFEKEHVPSHLASPRSFFVNFSDDYHFWWNQVESQCGLICISLMAQDSQHHYRCLFAICTAFENCLFRSFAHLLIAMPVILLSNLRVLYVFWVLTPRWVNSWQKSLSHLGGCFYSVDCFFCWAGAL